MQGNRMQQLLETAISSLGGRIPIFSGGEKTDREEERADDLAELTCQVEEARQEWHTARAYFETVSDPELIDQAAHLVLASQKRYTYLLKQVKKAYSQRGQA